MPDPGGRPGADRPTGAGPDGGGPEEATRWPVPGALDGERLDRAIALVTGLPRSEVERLVSEGRVTVGRRVITTRSRRVRAGERVRIEGPLGPDRAAVPVSDHGVEVTVVYADADLVVVDKPAGLVVHPGAGNREGTLVHGLLARFPDLGALAVADDRERPGIVHRLDKGTSGLLVVARTPQARTRLAAQLAARTMGREYLALVAGDIESDAGLVDAPLGRSDADPTRIRVQAGGRPARTRYEVEERFAGPPALTLIRCRLETGRTHQIRVHLASIGHPVLNDERYGGPASPDLGPARPFLHAASLAFDHPSTGERMRFESPVPPDLLRLLHTIRRGAPGQV